MAEVKEGDRVVFTRNNGVLSRGTVVLTDGRLAEVEIDSWPLKRKVCEVYPVSEFTVVNA